MCFRYIMSQQFWMGLVGCLDNMIDRRHKGSWSAFNLVLKWFSHYAKQKHRLTFHDAEAFLIKNISRVIQNHWISCYADTKSKIFVKFGIWNVSATHSGCVHPDTWAMKICSIWAEIQIKNAGKMQSKKSKVSKSKISMKLLTVAVTIREKKKKDIFFLH